MAKKSKKQAFITKKQFILYNLFAGTLLLVTLLGLSATILSHNEQHTVDPSQVRPLVVSAVDALTTEAPDVPQNNTQYIPEMSVQFTVIDPEIRLAYGYNVDQDGSHEHAHITTNFVKNGSAQELYTFNTFNSYFTHVPQYQACADLFVLTFSETDSEFGGKYELASEVDIPDGRHLRIWKNTGTLCKSADSQHVNSLLDTLQTAQVY